MYEKTWQKVLPKNPGRALDVTANMATAAASRNPDNVMSTQPELINFYNTGKGLYLSKFVQLMLYKGFEKVIDYTHQHHLKILIWNND